MVRRKHNKRSDIEISSLQYVRTGNPDRYLSRRCRANAASTTLAKFLKNVESRIYAQLSKQMVDNMFTDDGSTTGTATIEGATINWVKDVTTDTITITITGDDGQLQR